MAVLHAHCAELGLDPGDVEITNLSTVLIAEDRDSLRAELNGLRPRTASADAYAAQVNADLAEDHIGRFRRYAGAGVQNAIVTMPALSDSAPITHFVEVIAAFR